MIYEPSNRPDKPLRGFISIFKWEKVNITNCNQEIVIIVFKKGLHKTPNLYNELSKYLCSTMMDVLSKAWAQIKWEEDTYKLRNKPMHRRPDREDRSQQVDIPKKKWNVT